MAAPDTNNPYAAPSELSTPCNGPSDLWQIDGIGLLVANGAVLPKIDLETGLENPSLEEKERLVTKIHWVSRGWFLLCIPMFASLSFIRDEGMMSDRLPLWISTAVIYGGAFILFGIVAILLKPLNQQLNFTTWVDPLTERRRNRKHHIRSFLYVFCIVALIYPLVSLTMQPSPSSGKLLGGAIVAAVGMLALGIWQYYDRPKIHMTFAADGWVKLKGVHFDAIRRLETWNSQPPEVP
jgi:hypothetical protein